MRMLSTIAVLFCWLSMTPGPALAQLGPAQGKGQTVAKVTPEQFASALTAAGYRSQVATANNQKYIKTAMAGYNALVFFYDCNNQGCGNFQFWVGFTKDPVFTIAYANAWNERWRFVKAAIDSSDGGLLLTQDFTIGGGVSLDNIKEHAGLFDYILRQLGDFKP